MTLSFSQHDGLRVTFDTLEMVWGVRFRRSIHIPAAHLTGAWRGMPKTSWRELRVPGSFLPGLIKAGRYLTPRGTEFWYVTRKKRHVVTLELSGEAFDRLVLGFEDDRMIAESGLSFGVPPKGMETIPSPASR